MSEAIAVAVSFVLIAASIVAQLVGCHYSSKGDKKRDNFYMALGCLGFAVSVLFLRPFLAERYEDPFFDMYTQKGARAYSMLFGFMAGVFIYRWIRALLRKTQQP